MKDFHFLVANCIGVEGNWRLHCNQRQQLQHMILHHIADSSCLFVVAATTFYPQIFRHRNLHAVNVATVPDWLKDAISQAEDEDVLHGLLTQIMVDTIDLLFFEDLANLTIQLMCRSEVMPK